MEYACLILQIIFILGTFLFRTNDRYLVKYDEYYKECLFNNIKSVFETKFYNRLRKDLKKGLKPKK